jgi:hypothetical protein
MGIKRSCVMHVQSVTFVRKASMSDIQGQQAYVYDVLLVSLSRLLENVSHEFR